MWRAVAGAVDPRARRRSARKRTGDRKPAHVDRVGSGDPMVISSGRNATSLTHYYRGEYDEAIAEAEAGLLGCPYDVDVAIAHALQTSGRGQYANDPGRRLMDAGSTGGRRRDRRGNGRLRAVAAASSEPRDRAGVSDGFRRLGSQLAARLFVRRRGIRSVASGRLRHVDGRRRHVPRAGPHRSRTGRGRRRRGARMGRPVWPDRVPGQRGLDDQHDQRGAALGRAVGGGARGEPARASDAPRRVSFGF